MADLRDTGHRGPGEAASEADRTGVAASRWGAGAVLGAVTGLAPHLLHHAGLLVGTAAVTGFGGTALFAVLGLAAMTPMLLRLRRRFRSWWAPGLAVLLFAAVFAAATAIGPALRDAISGEPSPGPSHSTPRHHG